MTVGKIHQHSEDSVASQLDLFAVPFTQTSVLDGQTVEIGPIRDSPNSQLEFEIEGSEDNYIDLQNVFIAVQCKVKTASGANLPADHHNVKVVPVNNFLHSIFSVLSISVNGQEIEYESSYPFKSYMESLVNMGSAAKKTHMATSLWIQDKTGVIDTANIVPDDHKTDLENRAKHIVGSKTLDLMGRLHSSLFHQQRYLLPKCSLRIKLLRSDPSFCLIKTDADDPNQYKVDITKCDLLVRKVKVHPSIVASHNSLLLSKNSVKYPLNKVETQMFSISQGKQSERINVLINRQQPKRLLFALVDHEAKNGNYLKDPFNFAHFNLSSIVLNIDGHPVPNKPIRLDYDDGIYTQAYLNLATVSGKAFSDEDNAITRSMFPNGYAIYAFDLTGDQCEGFGVHLIRNCSITLELTFKKALDKTVSLFCYSELDDLLEIDNSRTVTRISRV